jgi:hypothetical protein
MTLRFFLLCGFAPAFVMLAGWLSWVGELKREDRSRAAGWVPVPGHFFAMSLMFKVFLPGAASLLIWILWGLLSWVTA